MSLFRGTHHRTMLMISALILLIGALTVVPAVAQTAPDITGITESDTDIDAGETRFVKVAVTGYVSGGVFTFSGDGLTASVVRSKTGSVRLLVTADATASSGLRSLTLINPDGLSDTLADALLVNGDIPPPDTGDITGHVFDDANGNGVEDGAEGGLSGVSISGTDANGGSFSAVTDGSGDYTIADAAVGSATVVAATPSGTTNSTGNATQNVTVVVDSSVAAADVGFQGIPSGDITGHVFTDDNGNGVEDGADAGLGGVAVTVTDAEATMHNAVTDGSGNFTLTGLAAGAATVEYAPPVNATLTTDNNPQGTTIVDGGSVASAAVGFQLPAGTPPDITGITEPDQTIDPGETRFYRIAGTNLVDGATWTFSGSGLTASVVRFTPSKVRLSVTAAANAPAGLRDLTTVNPDGLSDTFIDAITVTGDNPPSDAGTVTGRVFVDNDGNGIEDGADTGIGGVAVTFVDADASTVDAVTLGSGDFSLVAAPGAGTLTVATPSGFSLSTGNDSQPITVIQDATVGSAPVGYEPGDAVFVDVSLQAGVNTTHALGCGGPPIGVGAAWADIDNDGDQDLFRTNQSGNNFMYRNDGDSNGDGIPEFTDIAAAMGVQNVGESSFAAVFVDIDNDGDQDLFFADEDGNNTFENQLVDNGSLSFTDISATDGINDMGRIETAAFGDFDNDGFLDLYVAKHMTCAGIGDNIDHLYHNNGDNTFSDWTSSMCGGGAVPCDAVDGLGFAPAFFDMDNDGDQDLYLVNDNITNSNEPNKMFRNDGSDGAGGWVFTEVGAATGTGASVNGMGLGLGDYNNDGNIDIAYSDAAPGHLLSGNGDGTWNDVSGSSGVSAETAGDVGWGTAFVDYNNDGWQDLMFVTGGIGGPATQDVSLLGNNQDGTFTNVSVNTGMPVLGQGRSLALADMDGDGWVDMYIGNYNNDGVLLRNRSADLGATNSWLTVTLEGTDSNRDAIGATVMLDNEAGTLRQVLTSGSNHGGGSQKALFFGLGGTNGGLLTIEWPNGETTTMQISANQALHFVEPVSP